MNFEKKSPTILGLSGLKGSGKSTVAKYLVDKHGFVEKSFADCLKRACQEIFLLTEEQVFGTQEQKETPDPRWYGCTPRLILQYVGTDLLRNQLNKIMPELGTNIFTDHVKLWYLEEIKKNPQVKVVISDVRFPNEMDFVHNLGGKVIKIERPESSESTPSGSIRKDFHASETEMKNIVDFDEILINDQSIDDLYDLVDFIVYRLDKPF